MEVATAIDDGQSRSAAESTSIGNDVEAIPSIEQMTTSIDAALDLQEERTDIEQLKAKMTISQEQAKNKIDELTAAQKDANIVTGERLKTALQEERTKTENQIDVAIDKAASKPRTVGPRNLVVCIDGTSNQFGRKVRPLNLYYFKRDTSYHSSKNTNVIELYRLLDKDETQLTFYNSGIGTYATPSWKSLAYKRQQLDHKLDLAIAWYVLLFFSKHFLCSMSCAV